MYQERKSREAFGNSLFPKTIRDWNQLPANTTSATTVEGFRSAHLYIVLPVNSRNKAAVLPDTAQSFRGTLYIHVWIRLLNWKKKNANFYDTKWAVPTINCCHDVPASIAFLELYQSYSSFDCFVRKTFVRGKYTLLLRQYCDSANY